MILVCFARSSAELIGEAILEDVRKAENMDVKEVTVIDSIDTSEVGGVGGDHNKGEEPPHAGHNAGGDGPAMAVCTQAWTLRTGAYLGAMSEPCCIKLPQLCQKQLCSVSSFSSSSGSSTHG